MTVRTNALFFCCRKLLIQGRIFYKTYTTPALSVSFCAACLLINARFHGVCALFFKWVVALLFRSLLYGYVLLCMSRMRAGVTFSRYGCGTPFQLFRFLIPVLGDYMFCPPLNRNIFQGRNAYTIMQVDPASRYLGCRDFAAMETENSESKSVTLSRKVVGVDHGCHGRVLRRHFGSSTSPPSLPSLFSLLQNSNYFWRGYSVT